jgi:aryl-alcohol dehydrogenase-like predicted oxidoreductase
MDTEQPREPQSFDRRDFLRLGTAAGAGLLTGAMATPAGAAPAMATPAGAALPALPVNPRTSEAMPTRNLGRTGYRVGIFSLGGQAAIEQPDNEAVAVPIVERALDLGVNYVDTAAAYGGPQRWSQRYIGKVMKRRRKEAFLTSKTGDRTRDGSLRLLEESLRLLNTDHLDLWQIHNLSRLEQVDEIFAPGGAMEALKQAREQKLVRFLGVTGHADPEVLMEAIRRFEFDTLLLALNAADPHRLSFAEQLLPLAVEKQMGIIGMKIPARGRILDSWTPPPLDQQREVERPAKPGTLKMREALYYVLSLPVSTVIVGCDSVAQVEEDVALARAFTPLSPAQMAALTARTAPVAKQALSFRRWS